MHKRHPLLVCGVLIAFLLTSVQVYAGGPLLLFAPGVPFLWPNGGRMIPFNPDQGGLGTLSNEEAVAQSTAAFKAWADIGTASATHINGGPLPVDVDETNFVPYFVPAAPDGLSAIVYDEDGAIFNLLFGTNSGVLGFATPEWIDPTTGAIVEGVAFMNGGVLLEEDPFPVAEFLSIQVHEYGHYQNLAHTVVNGQIIVGPDSTGPSPFNTFPLPPSFANRIETMYPLLFINGGQATPHADDIAIFSSLYPAAGFATSTATITGRILAPNNRTRLTGVNVIARNIANPYDDAVSAISSDFATDYSPNAPFVGRYTLRGLTPGESYAVYVDEILEAGIGEILEGAFSTPPRILPGPEEFYNGADESNDAATDDPSVFTPVSAPAGGTVGNVNIVFNARPPGPIPLGDDTSVEIFPDFPMRFCGQTHDSVWVNANGNLTFGALSGSFVESAAAMLTGPPRIAALWDDLNPEASGTVAFAMTRSTLKITFTNVPEFPALGANSFSVTLRDGRFDGSNPGLALHGGLFSVDYDTLSATDGLAGYSCGGKVTSGFELESDLSALRFPIVLGLHKPAVYEVFRAADNDLDDKRFEVITPKPFRDEFEPNDNLPSATNGHGGSGELVKLPFNTKDRYSAIEPLGGDVDFFRFRAKAGEILAIETLPGSSMDTMLGLFDEAGNLLAADDDGGVGGIGTLSRLLVQVPADGIYAVGVTTWPDFKFIGAGSDFGRYVLNISTYTGTILPLADDGSIEIPLATFQFPFQGGLWSSVWVNGNGNLTFGAGDPDFSESVAELLAGPPRIAPLWDDLSPANPDTGVPQGLVIAEERAGRLRVHFVSVPEFLTTGTNYFTVTLDHRGEITMSYGATNRSDAIVGVTEGAGAADPGPIDISRTWLSAIGTTYEQFAASFGTYGGVDLSFREIVFKKPR